MIKAELHIHSLGGSYCAQLPAKEIVKRYKQAGYGALMLTNHYSKRCFGEYPVSEFKDKIDYFFSLFDEFKDECDKEGIKARSCEECGYEQTQTIPKIISGGCKGSIQQSIFAILSLAVLMVYYSKKKKEE